MTKITLFEHLGAIYTNKSLNYYDELDDTDKTTYNVFILNRFISMNIPYLSYVNLAQEYQLDKREHFLFFSQLLPNKKVFKKYIKKSEKNKYSDELIESVINYFKINKKQAIEYLDILPKEEIEDILKFYGTEPKIIKKLLKEI